MDARYIARVGRIDEDAAPQPAWRTCDGDVLDASRSGTGDVELDLTGDRAVVRRKQRPRIDHPWAENWPTWPSL